MNFMRATVVIAGLMREVKIGFFADDTKEDFYRRYVSKVCTGVEGAILNRLIKLFKEEDSKNGITVIVEIEPWGWELTTVEYFDINNVVDLCGKLAELSLTVQMQGKRNKK